MPEFEQRKRKTMSQQELYNEYHSSESTARKSSSHKSSAAKSKNNTNRKNVSKKKSSHRENPPVSAERKRMQEELSQKQTAAKKSKTYAGKTTGKLPKNSTSSSSKSISSSKTRSKNSSKSSSSSLSGSSASRSNRKKRTGRYTLYYVLIGIVAVVALTILSTTVLFNIGAFVVSGETKYSDEQIIEASGIKLGDNLLKINAGKAEEKIVSSLVYIESAKVHRGFPNRLTFSVEPAKAVAAFAYGGKYYVISENKRLLEISDTPLNCPVIKGVQIILQPKEEKPKQTTDVTVIDTTVPTSKEGITLENDEQEIKVGVVLGDDNDSRIKLALSIVTLMTEYGLKKDYEVNIADTLGVKISYDGHILMELGTTAALNDKIYHASRIIEEDIAESENCILNLTNPNRAVKRPVYDNDDSSTVTTTEPEDITEPDPDSDPDPEPEE